MNSKHPPSTEWTHHFIFCKNDTTNTFMVFYTERKALKLLVSGQNFLINKKEFKIIFRFTETLYFISFLKQNCIIYS